MVELARPYGDPPTNGQTDLAHLEEHFAALDACLTDAELAALDWD